MRAVFESRITGYYRDLDRQTLNGDEAEFSVCDDDSLPATAPDDTLCFVPGGDDDDDDDAPSAPLVDTVTDIDDADETTAEDEGFPLVDARDTGRFITTRDAAGDAAFNRTDTRAQVPVPGYTVANLRSRYRLTDNVEILARVENLFGNEYATFGVLAELEIFLSEAPEAHDPRFLSPGNPRSGFAGLRVTF